MTRKHRIPLYALTVALVGAAIAAPAAFAYPIDRVLPNPDEQSLIATLHPGVSDFAAPNDRGPASVPTSSVRPNPDEIGSGPRSLSAQQFARLTRPQVPVVHVESNPGFDWGDAGIGAGAMFALTMITVGSVLVLNGRRQRATTA
jgi:hypothetical protein